MKALFALILPTFVQFCAAAVCNQDNVLRALLHHSDDASFFCATYLGTSSLSASVITYDITIVGGTTTSTYGPTEIATVFDAHFKTISTKTSTTVYASQVPARVASSTLFSIPTPATYVATYPVSRISSACSCLSVSVQNIPVNVNCEGLPSQYVHIDTFTEYSVSIATGGKSTTTLRFTTTSSVYTSTSTVSLPFPTVCPHLAFAQYIGADGSPWNRYCANSWGGSSIISSGKATSLDNCIDQCVSVNQNVKYTECIGVQFLASAHTCDLLSFTFFPNGNGIYEIAGLDFYEAPFPTLPPGFCQSAVSNFLATAAPRTAPP
jgi:hypothetical protein